MKYFFSKGDSPKKPNCYNHDNEEIDYICLSCDNKLLCLKCINNKIHRGHEVKNLKKGVDYLREQITFGKLEAHEKI